MFSFHCLNNISSEVDYYILQITFTLFYVFNSASPVHNFFLNNRLFTTFIHSYDVSSLYVLTAQMMELVRHTITEVYSSLFKKSKCFWLFFFIDIILLFFMAVVS